jgi:flavin-dependent dehydrogenase
MSFDVVIVGAGPSGLSAGIRLAQLAQEQERTLTICNSLAHPGIGLTGDRVRGLGQQLNL